MKTASAGFFRQFPAWLYHLNKRLVFEEEMDKEEVGTRWFFNRDKSIIDIFRLETKFWKSCVKRTAP